MFAFLFVPAINNIIKNNPWGVWEYSNDYSFDCTSFTDSASISGPGNILLTPGDTNLVTFTVPRGGPVIYACGAVISGTFTPPSPSVTPSVSITPTNSPALVQSTWNTTAPGKIVRTR